VKLKDTATHAKITRSMEIEPEGAPVLPLEYSRDDKRFRVTRITITYTWTAGRWTNDSYAAVQMTGPVLKKDGTDSKNDHTRYPAYGWPRDPDMYPWLTAIVDLLRPTTDMILTTGTFEVPWGDIS
jgi:hypothetical protein